MNTVTDIREIGAHAESRDAGHTRVRTGFPYRMCLVALFLLSLPIVNPWVRGDGVGYYAFARALLIDHNLRFEQDWLAANPSFRQGRVDAAGVLLASQYTRTGYLDNHFTIGPAILWAPFLGVAHGAVLLANGLGANIAADGFSRPYVLTMALATAAYGFAGLMLAFDLARQYADERWAFLATAGIWLGSSLPVYMYFNPSWSHAQSAFAVALFLWFWHRTRDGRTLAQWCALAVIAGLMMNIYYPNVIVLLVPALEAAVHYFEVIGLKDKMAGQWTDMLAGPPVFLLLAVIMLTPTFVTRRIIYGSAFATGYPPVQTWNWGSPKLLAVLFSSDHGMLSWTPILALAIAGLALFCKRHRLFGGGLLLSFLVFYYFIASYPDWDGLSSFGNRFFVSLTPMFVIGLALALDGFARMWQRPGSDFAVAAGAIAILILWNLGFVFQWGTQMLPARGRISWAEMVHNQYAEVPRRVSSGVDNYFERRSGMMKDIEKQDLRRRQLAP
jgi:hypothetical protein